MCALPPYLILITFNSPLKGGATKTKLGRLQKSLMGACYEMGQQHLLNKNFIGINFQIHVVPSHSTLDQQKYI